MSDNVLLSGLQTGEEGNFSDQEECRLLVPRLLSEFRNAELFNVAETKRTIEGLLSYVVSWDSVGGYDGGIRNN